jgi:hypothetical protein
MDDDGERRSFGGTRPRDVDGQVLARRREPGAVHSGHRADRRSSRYPPASAVALAPRLEQETSEIRTACSLKHETRSFMPLDLLFNLVEQTHTRTGLSLEFFFVRLPLATGAGLLRRLCGEQQRRHYAESLMAMGN